MAEKEYAKAPEHMNEMMAALCITVNTKVRSGCLSQEKEEPVKRPLTLFCGGGEILWPSANERILDHGFAGLLHAIEGLSESHSPPVKKRRHSKEKGK